MGGNGRARKGERESVLKSVAFVCKMIYKRTIEMKEVYINESFSDVGES